MMSVLSSCLGRGDVVVLEGTDGAKSLNEWCRRWESNPHAAFAAPGFKSTPRPRPTFPMVPLRPAFSEAQRLPATAFGTCGTFRTLPTRKTGTVGAQAREGRGPPSASLASTRAPGRSSSCCSPLRLRGGLSESGRALLAPAPFWQPLAWRWGACAPVYAQVGFTASAQKEDI